MWYAFDICNNEMNNILSVERSYNVYDISSIFQLHVVPVIHIKLQNNKCDI